MSKKGCSLGRKGVGLGKRALSPSAEDRASKAAKLQADETISQERNAFRDRSRAGYEERRAAGRLAAARKTCINLDERQGIEVRVSAPFWNYEIIIEGSFRSSTYIG